MKCFTLKSAGCALAFVPLLANADTSTFNFNNVNLSIPDRGMAGSASGVVNNQVISGLAGTIITGIQISLNIVAGTDLNGGTSAINGDFYVALYHTDGTNQEGFSVLLNRAGVASTNIGGYYDNGFNITFSDTADTSIHFYQNTTYHLNEDGQLTGTWQPDGEYINPESDASVFDNAAENQTALLNSFYGFGADGTWSLFLFDAESGGAGELSNWTLTINTVPEPGEIGLFTAGLIACAGLRRRFCKR